MIAPPDPRALEYLIGIGVAPAVLVPRRVPGARALADVAPGSEAAVPGIRVPGAPVLGPPPRARAAVEPVARVRPANGEPGRAPERRHHGTNRHPTAAPSRSGLAAPRAGFAGSAWLRAAAGIACGVLGGGAIAAVCAYVWGGSL